MLNRNPTLGQVINRAVKLGAIQLRVSMPGQVVHFDAETNTVDVQPLLPETRHNDDDTYTTYKLPTIYTVPVQFYGDASNAITVPVEEGTECLLVFSDRSLDTWFNTGEVQDPNDLRRHDMSDAVAIIGIRNKQAAWPEVDTSRMAMGKLGGPKVAFSDDLVEIGQAHNAQAADFAALAAKVDAGFSQIVQYLASHTHVFVGSGAVGIPAAPPTSVPSTAASKVKIT